MSDRSNQLNRNAVGGGGDGHESESESGRPYASETLIDDGDHPYDVGRPPDGVDDPVSGHGHDETCRGHEHLDGLETWQAGGRHVRPPATW